MMTSGSAYDRATGTAGGPAFGAALSALAQARSWTPAELAAQAGLDAHETAELLAGRARAGVTVLAALARALRLRAIAFLQQSEILSLDVYAAGLDPLFFLPAGGVRHDARIYMREINPRHAVPENDMTRRNPVLAAVAADALLDAQGKLEIELAYLLRTATGPANASADGSAR